MPSHSHATMRLAAALLALLATGAAGGGEARHWAAGLSDARLAHLLLEQPTARLEGLAKVCAGVRVGRRGRERGRERQNTTQCLDLDLPSSQTQVSDGPPPAITRTFLSPAHRQAAALVSFLRERERERE